MALVRWDPARELTGLQSDMNRLFDSFFQTSDSENRGGGARRWIPSMDLVTTDDALILKADLPGLSDEDISVEVRDGVLTVSGERRAEHERSEEGYYRLERSFGHFSRSVTLPDNVDEDDVSASMDNGVLEVRIPKPEERQPKKIEIGSKGAIDERK